MVGCDWGITHVCIVCLGVRARVCDSFVNQINGLDVSQHDNYFVHILEENLPPNDIIRGMIAYVKGMILFEMFH